MKKLHFGNTTATSDVTGHVEQGLFSGEGNQFPAENSENSLYKCPKCGTAFIHKEDLGPHLKLVCGKPFWQCPYCSSTARSKAYLKQHITHVHTNSVKRLKQKRGHIVFK